MGDNAQDHARPPTKDNYYRTLNTFVRSQVRLLETPLRLPDGWRTSTSRAQEDGQSQPHHREPVPDHIVSAGLKRLNATTQKALRLNFSSQAVHQLLEQIVANQLEVKRRHRQGGIVVRTKSRQELLASSWIDAFPAQWRSVHGETSAGLQQSENGSVSAVPPISPTVSDLSNDSDQARQYQELRAHIVELQQKYRVSKEKHEYYENLSKEIRLLNATRIKTNVVGPNTPISQELAKMKTLVPRLVSILEVRKETLIAKRKRELESLSKDASDAQPKSKRMHTEPTDPLETMLNFLQS